jgi:cell division septal protein FtsQ
MIKFSNRLFRKKRKEDWRKKSWRKLTVSINSNFFFINKKNSQLKNFKKTLLACFVFFAVYFFLFSQFFLIKEITVKGNKRISSDAIKSVANDEIFEPILNFIPGNNFFFNKDENVKAALFNEFSEIKSVDVSKRFPNIMEIKVQEKEPIIIWCRMDSCYYLDGNGVAFLAVDNALKTDGKKFIRVFEQLEIKEELEDDVEIKLADLKENENESESESEDNNKKDSGEKEKSEEEKRRRSLDPIKAGDKISDRDFIGFVLDIDREIKNSTMLEIKYYKTKGTKTRELIAYTDRNVRLYFDTTESADLQIRNLSDFLSKGIEKEKIDFLKYIYLKAGNKVFYK